MNIPKNQNVPVRAELEDGAQAAACFLHQEPSRTVLHVLPHQPHRLIREQDISTRPDSLQKALFLPAFLSSDKIRCLENMTR